jgi:hypothetical protein
LAAAVAAEFAEPAEAVTENPVEAAQSVAGAPAVTEKSAAPHWIANYVAGGAPLEIEPIGLEKAAQTSAAGAAHDTQTSVAEPARPARTPALTRRAHRPQHSATLNRHFVKKPAAAAQARAARLTSAPVAQSAAVSHFAKATVSAADSPDVPDFVRAYVDLPEKKARAEAAERPVVATTPALKTNPAARTAKPAGRTAPEQTVPVKVATKAPAPILSASTARALQSRHAQQATEPSFARLDEQASRARDAANSQVLKNALIRGQLDAPVALSPKAKQRASKLNKKLARQTSKRKFRLPAIFATGMAVLLIGGYLTYTQMPNLTVRVAAARAGIEATVPYTPNGYSIDGPVAYQTGEITIQYKSNGGGAGYSLTQQKSTWDAEAIRADLSSSANADFSTIEVGGTTVFRYDNRAMWAQNGMLYSLDGNDTMSTDQISKIAASV